MDILFMVVKNFKNIIYDAKLSHWLSQEKEKTTVFTERYWAVACFVVSFTNLSAKKHKKASVL